MSDNSKDVFEEFLDKIAEDLNEKEVYKLGKALGFPLASVTLYNEENARKVNHMGTWKMLQEWLHKQPKATGTQKKTLKAALQKAKLPRFIDEYLSADDVEQQPRPTPAASTGQGASSQYQERELASTATENLPVQPVQSHVTETSEPPSVFISYQWDKQPEIKILFSHLTDLGYHCWLDIDQIGGGDVLYSEIEKGVKNAKVVISCMTPAYVLSKNCKREVSLSDALRKPIIPLLLDKMTWPPRGPMSMTFTELVYIDFTKETTETMFKGKKFDELIKMINKYTQPMIEIMPATEERNVDEHLQTATPQAEVSEQLQASASSS